jgi:hypothetical protein
MTLVRCPICDRPFDPATAAAMPFCSERCRTIDLARWLGEKYSVPLPPRHEDDADGQSDPQPPNGHGDG